MSAEKFNSHPEFPEFNSPLFSLDKPTSYPIYVSKMG